MSNQIKILLSRFLTRFGDQAWEFAIPLTLISIFPGQIQYVAGFYLASKLAQFFIIPSVLRWIDHLSRLTIYRIGIGAQTFSVITTWILIYFSSELFMQHGSTSYWITFGFLTIFGIFGSLGATLMEVSVGFDLAADVLKHKELSVFNSRLKRVDLVTEVTAPLAAGILLMTSASEIKYFGFSLIAFLNILTFIPEYFLLSSIPETKIDSLSKVREEWFSNPIKEFKAGYQYFEDRNYVIPMTAYAFLWLSALSPHGVLLSGYLKDVTHLTEIEISIFRGLGAFFGLAPTFLYPILNKKAGLILTSKIFLGFQLMCIIGATYIFQSNLGATIYIFLALILLSRIGLYGYSIAESEARQLFIPASKRGRINGVGVSMTNLATLLLFLLGSVLSNSNQFEIIIWVSCASVLIGFIILLNWNKALTNNGTKNRKRVRHLMGL